MRLQTARIQNYRTLESIDLTFPSLYAAICGPNDSGKTNVVRALKALFRGETPGQFMFPDDDEFSPKDSYPKWKETEPSSREITFDVTVALDATLDIGFYQSVKTQLELNNPPDPLALQIRVIYRGAEPEPSVEVRVGDEAYSGLGAEQVLKTLQSSRSILFHNSTESETRYVYPRRSIAGHIRELTGEHASLVATMKKNVSRVLARISKSQQTEFEGLLGRLQSRYKVGLSLPPFDFGYLPFSITLGDKKVEVPLDDWGSGTRNRTLILLSLFRAKQIGKTIPSASKVTPVLIIEEPESFLHPSAQAEFGRVLRDLAEEFSVQVIVTTHSPYLLNLRDPASNILLCRRTSYNQLRETDRVDTTGENWMVPFGKALEVDTEEFKPWKDMILAGADTILLVEGETDKTYFEMLREPVHGKGRLELRGDIFAYGGVGALANNTLLRFIKNTHRKFFVTFDLDAAEQVEKTLRGLQLERGRHFLPIGQDLAGKRTVEGLLPEAIIRTVYQANAGLVQAATAGNKTEKDRAIRQLKVLFLEEFRRAAKPGDDFKHFYEVTRVINKALS